MPAEDRERQLRQRLAAYVARQTARTAAYDRLAATGENGGAPDAGPRPQEQPDAAERPGGRAAEPGLPHVTVVVPIHDAADELRACLWSLARNTTRDATLLLIDDASLDPGIDDLLSSASELENVTVLRNVQNLGFPATVNRGLRAARGDVVLLNSDTEVGPRWLEQLVAAAYATPATGSVTPLSDNAGAFSAPEIDVANPMPPALGADDIARLVARAPGARRPLAPTGNGFCLYLRRSLIDAVGELDAVSFPAGYGEENDLCMRAGRLGWGHVVDDRTFVRHRRAASFGQSRTELRDAARRRMAELHPDYPAAVRSFIADPDMRAARERVGRALAQGARGGVPRPRLLFVVHEGGGGAVATNRDLMGALAPEFACHCFSSDRHVLRLRRIEGAHNELIDEWQLERPLLLGDVSRPDYRLAFSSALDQVAPELVHVRHLFKHTFDAPRLAAARELPVVMSFHDHYFLCPTIHLLDDRGRYCAGRCTPGGGQCPTVRAGSLPPLKHAFVHQWREEVEAAVAGVDAFVTTSEYTRDIHRRFLRATRDRPFELIEHGRDLIQRRDLADAPRPGGPVRILVPGHLSPHKGADFLAALAELDRGRRLELHFVGEVPARYRRLGVSHGAYERDDLVARVQQIRPAFVGVFSVTGESYSHAITEAWAAGVPVLATDRGAQAERVRAHGGGFLVSADDPSVAIRQILAAADHPSAYAREQSRASVASVPTVADMAAAYADLYRDVIENRRPFAAPPTRRSHPLARGVWRVVAGDASPDGLLARRLTHPSLRWKLRARIGACATGADLVLAGAGGDLTGAVPGAGATPVVWLAEPPAPGGESDPATQALLEATRLVIAPSTELAAFYARRHGHVAVLPASLDERLFLDPAANGAPAIPGFGQAQTLRLVYVDPDPGADELELLRSALARIGAGYELDVVSAGEADPGGDWYRLVRVPDPMRDYARYAERLRALRPGWHAALLPRCGLAGSDLRRLECAALGLPVIESASDRNAGRDGVESLVCENEAEAWAEAIERLAGDDQLAEALRECAWRDVVAGRLMRHQTPAVLDILGRALEPLPVISLAHAG